MPKRNISAMHIGATYLRHITNNGKVFTPILPSLVRVSLRRERSNIHPAKNDINMPPSGRRIFDEVKSKNEKKSSEHRPKTLLSLKYPKDNALKTPPHSAMMRLSADAFVRVIFFSSVKNAIDTSLIEIVEVRDAKNRRKKKRIDHNCPPGICVKIEGKTSNTSAGPCTGDMPKENTAGKIIKPARIATSVSSEAVIVALRTMRVSLEK